MDLTNIIVGLSCIGCAAVYVGLAIPLLHDRIKPNMMYGMRIAKALESDDNWYAVNRYGARQFVLWAVPLALFGVVCFFLPPMNENVPLAIGAGLVPVWALIPPVVATLRYARTL